MPENKISFSYSQLFDYKETSSIILGFLLFFGVFFLVQPTYGNGFPQVSDTIPTPRRGTGTPASQDTMPQLPESVPQPDIQLRDTLPAGSERTQPEIIVQEESEEKKPEAHSPLKATMLSVALPGLGQAYNGRYWKIPVIYAGFTGVWYAVNLNNNFYQSYRRSYFASVDGNPNTTSEFPEFISSEQLRNRMNTFRRFLEIAYITGAALYILNVLDATVDAHLLDFDVSEELGMNLQPAIIPALHGTGNSMNTYAGLRLTFRF
ncbi:MAG: DUF5683 domain-containing protein [Bacteroidales bacterium]